MAVTRVQAISGQSTGVATLTLTLGAAPTAGNLLVFVCTNLQSVTQTGATITGFTQDALSDTTVVSPSVVLSRIADGAEGTSFTLTWSSFSTGVVAGELMELSPGTGRSWATTRPAAAGAATATSNTTITATATGATTGASYAVAVLGIGGTAAFLHTWTNGFAWDSTTVASGRMEVAVKESTGAETLSTTETWDTARTSRVALAAYHLTEVSTGPAIPTGLTATPFSSTQINLSWTSVSGATAYDIERDGTVIVYGHPLTTYSDTGLGIGTAHTYRVRSVA